MKIVFNSKPRFIMLVGIPGSGKTSYAKKLVNDNTLHITSDGIREELFGDAGCQKDNNRVFSVMHVRTVEALKNGFNVIYDATNITRKNRKAILDKLPEYVTKECIIVWAPIEVCIQRDRERDRTVGVEVIDKMLRRFEAPFYDEGFDEIRVNRSVYLSDIPYAGPSNYYLAMLSKLDIPHDNPHHTLSVYDHCVCCSNILKEQDVTEVLQFAGLVHDIGKPYTKTFTNWKGEATDIAHYYDHASVGAWICYGFANLDILVIVAWLVSSHMTPFTNLKYYNSLDPLYKNWIDVLHKADKEAH